MSRQKNNRPTQNDNGSTNVVDIAMKAVLAMLPLHAEEGRQREIVVECKLIDMIAAKGIPKDTASALIYALRRQFDALALLDLVELQKGNWAFVSFPASLLGRAWLVTLATPGQALLPPDYWEQGEHRPDEAKEEQRALLHRMETERLHLNPQAQPIRTVHVAWALLRWGNKFLLHRREDKARQGEKGYGMIGGRFNLSDLPPTAQSRAAILREVFNLDSAIVARHIAATLQREVAEETGMLMDKHYTCAPFGQQLPPYLEVNGAGNRHAYSAYKFHLFQVKLTPAGETHLLARVAGDEQLTWFAAAEIASSQRADGAAAYVSALRQAWGEDLERNLASAPDSASSPTFTGETMMLDLPGAPDAPFQLGKPGKEKALCLARALTQEEWQLLMLLGWHTRGFHIELAADAGMRLLGNGWLDAQVILPIARGLLHKVQPVLPGLVEIREERFVSLRAMLEILFFAADLFHYRLEGNSNAGGVFRLNRPPLAIPWGRLCDDSFVRPINGKTMATLRELERGDEPAGDWERTLRDQFGEGVKGVGIRRMWSTKGNVTSLVEGLKRG